MDKELKENAEILLYSLDDSNIYVDVYFEDEKRRGRNGDGTHARGKGKLG